MTASPRCFTECPPHRSAPGPSQMSGFPRGHFFLFFFLNPWVIDWLIELFWAVGVADAAGAASPSGRPIGCRRKALLKVDTSLEISKVRISASCVKPFTMKPSGMVEERGSGYDTWYLDNVTSWNLTLKIFVISDDFSTAIQGFFEGFQRWFSPFSSAFSPFLKGYLNWFLNRLLERRHNFPVNDR